MAQLGFHGSAASMLVGETTCGGFETLRVDKTQGFITKSEAYKYTQKLNTIHALSLYSLSSVPLNSLHTQ